MRKRGEEERAKATEYIISLSALELDRDWGVKPKKKPKAALCVTRARPPATWELYPHTAPLSSDIGGV